jgi:hypothetical protein
MNLEYLDAQYARGFDAGERAAFRDRRVGRVRIKPLVLGDTYELAWWDGYTPRTSTWARNLTTSGWWTAEREGEPA